MTRDQQVTAIAEAFAETMRQWLSKGEFAAMVHRNQTNPDPDICASHDFCDSNMAMCAAFEDVMGRSPLPPEGEMTEADCALWGEAWTLARKLHLGHPSSA